MEIAGYLASLFIGFTLGLIGGGGSILTLPVLVYLFGIAPSLAVTYSLFIVGVTSYVGAFNNYRRNLIHLPTAYLFGPASVITVIIIRKFIVPALPDVFFTIGSFEVTQGLFTMVVFALLMLAASYSMITNKKPEAELKPKVQPVLLAIYGVFIGMVTGFLGAGGGFLMIPAFVLVMRLPMKKAIGTSLLIIAVNSSIGFLSDLGQQDINWRFIILLTLISTFGLFVGGYSSRRIDGIKLKTGFGWFVLLMGILIIIREIFQF